MSNAVAPGLRTTRAQSSNQLASFTSLPPNGQAAVYRGTNRVTDMGVIFVGDDDIENISGVIVVQTETLLSVSVSFTNSMSDMDFFVFKPTERASIQDLSEADIIDSSALSGNPEAVGPVRLGVLDARLGQQKYAFGPGKYVFGLSIFDAPAVQPTDWTLTVRIGGDSEELIGDSGLPNSGVNVGTSSRTVIQVNRVTPARYPFRVTGVRFLTFRFEGQVSPLRQRVDIIVFTAPIGSTTPPARAAFNETTVPIQNTDQWVDYPIPNGPVAKQGEEIFVGYRFTTRRSGIFPTIDVGRKKLDRSFISRDNGTTWASSALTTGAPADLCNRVLGTPGT